MGDLPGGTSRRPGAHRAAKPRRDHRLTVAASGAAVVLAAAAVVGGTVLFSGGDDPDTDRGPVDTARQAGALTSPSPSSETSRPASDPARAERREAGRALSRNESIALGVEARRDLRRGDVDSRLMALLVQLSAQSRLGVVELTGDGPLRTGALIGAVDGGPVDSPAGAAVADLARSQVGVFEPAEVTETDDGLLLVRYDPSDAPSLSPVPLS